MPAATNASISVGDVAGVPTPIVSPRLSWLAPRSKSRLPTSTTCSIGTSPSHGSPKHIET